MSEATPETIENPATETVAEMSVQEPASIEQTPSGEPPKKRRGRPPGSGKKTPEQIEGGGTEAPASKPSNRKASTSNEQRALMGKQLVGIHKLAAMVTGLPELMINDVEGDMLAHAVANICDEYGLAVDGKTGATLQLLGTAAMIYGPRAIAVMQRAHAEKQQRQQNSNVGQPA